MAASRIASLTDEGAERLRALPNGRLDAELLFRSASGLTRAQILAHPQDVVTEDVAKAFRTSLERREKHEPVQYITGRAAFWRDEFKVTPAVLIPRPETEMLVELLSNGLRAVESPLVLDIGTGSGCIALSILRELPAARAVGIDISDAALAIAQENAGALGLNEPIAFVRSHWLDALGSQAFDAIVSNPPYVAKTDEASLPRDVREFEPHLALFADEDDDLSSYRAIVESIGERLKTGGLLAFEVGVGQAERVADLLTEGGYGSVAIRVDLQGIPRVVLGRRS